MRRSARVGGADVGVEEHVLALREDGYTVIRRALAESEIAQLRQAAKVHFSSTDRLVHLGGGRACLDAFNDPQLHSLLDLVEKDSVLDPIRGILGPNLCFYGSDVFNDVFTGWHTDDLGVGSWSHPGERESNGSFKVAVYLQDHTNRKGALRMKRGSHLGTTDAGSGFDTVCVRTGDVVVFDMRLEHAGTHFLVHPLAERLLTRLLGGGRLCHAVRRLLHRQERWVVFCAFGPSNAQSREHLRAVEEKNRSHGVEPSPPRPELARRLKSRGIAIGDDSPAGASPSGSRASEPDSWRHP